MKIDRIIFCSFVLLFIVMSFNFALVSCTVQNKGQALYSYGKMQFDGHTLYKSYCQSCHGDQGKGDGLAAVYLFPKPRNFSAGKFKLRTTPSGALPTDQDLIKTISEGIPGSSMPSFSFLTVDEQKALVEVVKEFTAIEIEEQDDQGNPVKKQMNLFKEYGASEPIKVGAAPQSTDELIRLGKEVYSRKGVDCWKCHGDLGLADGPSSDTLNDDDGYPIQPNNFQRGIFKGGNKIEDIYTRFSTGMMGTPMPSYEGTLTEKERWAIAYYVKSLSGAKTQVHKSNLDITAVRTDKEIEQDPLSSQWNNVQGTNIPLMNLWQRNESSDLLSVKAIYNDKQIGFLLEWDDNTVDGRLIKHQDFTDAVAMQFALTDPPGFYAMGSKGQPVNIWQWRFERQMDLAKYSDMEDSYPDMYADEYQFAKKSHTEGQDKPDKTAMTPASSHDKTYITGWGAGNIRSDPNRITAVEDLHAEGFGTLESLGKENQKVSGRGIWVAGKWKVVIVRDLTTEVSKEAQFKSGKAYNVAFGVWDGSAKDRDGQKLATYWNKLKLAK